LKIRRADVYVGQNEVQLTRKSGQGQARPAVGRDEDVCRLRASICGGP
jgi:hypothetical protein